MSEFRNGFSEDRPGQIVLTMLGYMIFVLAGIVAGTIFQLPSPAVAAAVAFGVVAGAAGGTMQWLVLRRQVARAGWWVLASLLGLTVGLGAGAPVALTLGQAGRAIESTAVFGTIFGVGVGAIPGAALVRHGRHAEGVRIGMMTRDDLEQRLAEIR